QDNFFSFGLTAPEIETVRSKGYRPREFCNENSELSDVINLIGSGYFSRGDDALFKPIIDGLLGSDPYFLMADYQSYVDCQAEVDRAYADREHWTRMSILNAARSGKFSSDRTIREYCEDIWKVEPVSIQLGSGDQIKADVMQ
ncbi:MAG: glycogen/starch/alpha-glucan phosphorylase, partial [Gammaproteobacteria bacterium]